MKTFKTILAVLTITFFAGCSSDDEQKVVQDYKTENPLEDYYAQTGFSRLTIIRNNAAYEIGFTFIPTETGNLKAITLKLPDANSSIRVTIWDYDSKKVLRTEIVNVAAGEALFSKTIDALALEKGKKYVITMNSNVWYGRSKVDNTNANYPIKAGNIQMLEYRWIASKDQLFPANVMLNGFLGDISFDFQQTE